MPHVITFHDSADTHHVRTIRTQERQVLNNIKTKLCLPTRYTTILKPWSLKQERASFTFQRCVPGTNWPKGARTPETKRGGFGQISALDKKYILASNTLRAGKTTCLKQSPPYSHSRVSPQEWFEVFKKHRWIISYIAIPQHVDRSAKPGSPLNRLQDERGCNG